MVKNEKSGILLYIGPLAQLVEHLVCNEGVAGSNPVRSTRLNPSKTARHNSCGVYGGMYFAVL